MDHVDTLEAFIEKLHSEGVEAGLQDAERMRATAEAESTEAVEQAREKARQMVAQAESRAEAILAEAKSELALAVRYAQLELRAGLEQALTTLLEKRVQGPLGDGELLKSLLREVVGAYARADAEHPGETIELDVRPELVEKLAAAVPGILADALADDMHVEVKAGLSTAGFEYRIRGAVVEVTPESVAEKLAEFVSPELRALLRSAADDRSAVAR